MTTTVEVGLKESDLHYLGGVVDSDGSIYVSVEQTHGGIGYRVRPRFRVEMKDVGTTKEIADLLVRLAESSDITHNLKRCDGKGTWRFEVAGNQNVVDYLELLDSYIRGKREQVEAVINAPWFYRGECYGMTERERKERFMELMGVRERVQNVNANRESKYDKEYFEKEFDL